MTRRKEPPAITTEEWRAELDAVLRTHDARAGRLANDDPRAFTAAEMDKHMGLTGNSGGARRRARALLAAGLIERAGFKSFAGANGRRQYAPAYRVVKGKKGGGA